MSTKKKQTKGESANKKQTDKKSIEKKQLTDREKLALENFRSCVDQYITRERIANEIGCETSTITNHYNGVKPIGKDMLIKYIELFDVSADYLLGYTSIRTRKESVKNIYEATGLTEQTQKCIDEIIACDIYGKYREYLNRFIQLFNGELAENIEYARLFSKVNKERLDIMLSSKADYEKASGKKYKTTDEYFLALEEDVLEYEELNSKILGRLFMISNQLDNFNMMFTGIDKNRKAYNEFKTINSVRIEAAKQNRWEEYEKSQERTIDEQNFIKELEKFRKNMKK